MRSPLVFNKAGTELYPITYCFKTLCQSAGMSYRRNMENALTFHDIRRTVKNNMLHAGTDKIYRNTLLRHALKGMDRYYMSTGPEALTAAMKKYTVWLDEQDPKFQLIDQN
jgi:hypothetical protein